ncbi:FAD-dependent oxidoreductase [bacterium]|nr:FAD-dependent oxidoreductase [bacterium]
MEEKDFVIIGTGPAGISAAVTAAKSGVDVTLIGEDPRMGGQIFRQIIPPLYSQTHYVDTQNEKIFNNLSEEKKKVHLQFLSKTLVWGIFDDKVLATDNKDHPLIKAKKLLISEGAYEAPVAFPGWTLPGVITLGGTQILLKSQGLIPRGRTLVAGTGPLLYYTASQLVKNGANVVGVLEASSLFKWMNWTFRLIRAPKLLWKGIQYLTLLKKRRIPIYYNHVVAKAEGTESLEKVIFTKDNNNWEPQEGTEKTLDVDTLCLNFGFIPSTIFTHMAGCEHEFDPTLRGWIPTLNNKLETSKEGIFVAGDCNGIGGVKKAFVEGQIAGTEIALQLGQVSKPETHSFLSRLQKKNSRLNWYQKFLKDIYAFRPGLLKLLTPETFICRCEEVDFKTITNTLENGAWSLDQIKRLTRMGMGRCQGRFCFPTVLGILSKYYSQKELNQLDFSTRPPAKPLPLKELI